MECPDCGGEGKIELFSSWEDPCKTCKGSGKREAKYQDFAQFHKVEFYLLECKEGKWVRSKEEKKNG